MIALAPLPLCLQYVDIGAGEDAVRAAIELNTGSMRALARNAGISIKLLVLIRDGERTATAATIEALAAAFEGMTEHTSEAARILRDTLAEEDQ